MDVVYNHTAEDSNEYNLEARFSFNGLAPRYYYRTCGNTPVAHNGESTCGRREPHEPRCGECYSNGSGCGNEFRSESPMGRKFIIDSLKFWVTEYGIDGFRFDLLGLIDVKTIQQAVVELKAVDSNIVVYGEPWIGGLSPIKATDKGSQRSKGFAVFNDTFRNAIRGSPFDTEETFIMDGGRLMEVKGGIIGSVDMFTDSPLESINYVECHDNRTLWDHLNHYIRSRTDTIKFSEEDIRRMHKLAAVVVLTSQGIPFIQAGQEMCRTKFDDENSYESSDEINMIRWSTKLKEWSTVQYYRGLILLRRAHPEIFCLETAEDIHEKLVFYEDCGLHVPDRCIAYRIKGDPEQLLKRLKEGHTEDAQTEEDLEQESLRWSEVVVLFNATPVQVVFELPGKKADVMWMQIVNALAAGTRTISGPHVGSVTVGGRSGAVMRHASPLECHDSQLGMRLASITDAYSSFHGDDSLSRYAVGLEPQPTSEEQALKNESISRRLQFQKRAGADDVQAKVVTGITSARTMKGKGMS
ncbi:Pullulanase Pul1 [Gracilaria domingensis]|nr:Pullulanase Pul1 [Gracilaria domingensis]